MKKQFKWNREVRIHIICWIAFTVYELVVIGLFRGTLANPWIIIFSSLSHIVFFYIHALVVLPYSFNNRSQTWWRLPVFILAGLLLYVLIYGCGKLFLTTLLDQESEVKMGYVQYFAGILFRCLYILFISTAYYFFMSTLRRTKQETTAKLEIEELKRKLLKSELSHIRAQINPYLLFNTLEFIGENTQKSPQKVDEAIMLLANRLDFASRSDHVRDVTLGEEIEQVNNLIALNRMRIEDRFNLRFETHVHDETISVLPLALLVLVENLFKNGDLEDKENPAEVYVETSNDRVVYRTRSLFRKNVTKADSDGSLENIRMRLETAFPDRFHFEFRKEERWYIVELVIHIIF